MEEDLMHTPAQRKFTMSRFSRIKATGATTNESVSKTFMLLDEFNAQSPIVNITQNRHAFITPGGKTATFTPGSRQLLYELDNSYNVNATGSLNDFTLPSQFERTRKDTPSMKDETRSCVSTSALLLQEDDTVTGICSKLSEEFYSSLSSLSAEHQVFPLLQEYEDLCARQLQNLQNTIGLPEKSARFRRLVLSQTVLRNERNTWRLLRTLYQDRIVSDSNDVNMTEANNQLRWSEKQIIEQLYDSQAHIRQAQIIVDWLEKNASEDITDKMEYFTDGSVAWENTLKRLKQTGGGRGDSGRAIVTELDPDAPYRQNKPLDDLDKNDEDRLLQSLFLYIRAGNIEEAQRLCLRCGQAWRAATLEGWRPYHDPNYSGVPNNGKIQPSEGNPNRHIWKEACQSISSDVTLSVFERAMYAALSGYLQNILPACRSWEDYLWAYYRTMLEMEVERELRSRTPTSMSNFADWGKTLSPDVIFSELAACDNASVREQAQNQYYVIQRYVIMDDLPGLVEEMHEWVKHQEKLSRHLIRLMAHLVLFFRTIGRSCREELAIPILEAYVQDLIETKQVKMLAFYVATLPEQQQIKWYARYLEEVEDPEERQLCLESARQANLDVSLITKAVVVNVRTKNAFVDNVSSQLNAPTTDEDKKVISALDWLVFDQSQRAELLWQANALARTFIACRKLDAAKEAFLRVPSDAIEVLTKTWQMRSGDTDLPYWQKVAVREYLCINSYLQAQDAFTDWFAYYHHGKPVAPQAPVRPTFTEKVAYEHCEQQYEAELDRWQHTLDLQTKSTVDRLYNVLLFLDGGWMVDPELTAEEEDGGGELRDEMESRRVQLDRLRGICLPQIALLLHTVLHTTAKYKECFHLADVIAAKDNKIYEVFSKDQLRMFLHRLQESSLKVLDTSHDGLGFNQLKKSASSSS